MVSKLRALHPFLVTWVWAACASGRMSRPTSSSQSSHCCLRNSKLERLSWEPVLGNWTELRAVVMRGIICEWLSAGTSRCSPRGFGIVFCLPRLTFVLCDSVVEFAVAVTERIAIYFLTPCCTPGVVLLAVIIPFYERAKVVLLDWHLTHFNMSRNM